MKLKLVTYQNMDGSLLLLLSYQILFVRAQKLFI